MAKVFWCDYSAFCLLLHNEQYILKQERRSAVQVFQSLLSEDFEFEMQDGQVVMV